MPATVIHPGKKPGKVGRFLVTKKAFPLIQLASMAEAGSAADSVSAAVSTNVAVIEVGIASDNNSALQWYGVTISEAGAALDLSSYISTTTRAFPSYMPYPMVSGFQQTSDFAILTTQMDSGPDKQRPRYSVPVFQRSVQYGVPSLTNRNAFEIWVRDTLAGGSLYFNWPDPLSGTIKLVRIVGGKVSYSPDSTGSTWIIQFGIEAYS